MSRFRPKLTYGNVVASIALFAALGGGVAWAHGMIGTQDLRNNAVTAQKLRNNAVTAQRIRPNHVRPKHVRGLNWRELELKNGWQAETGFATRPPEFAIDVQGVVHFRGAMSNETTTEANAFRIPPNARPEANVWTIAYATGGNPIAFEVVRDYEGGDAGEVRVFGPGNAQAFTSLEGVSYAR